MGDVGTRDRIPVTVLGGYLGAGKTTLLNHVLRTSAMRCAVLVNDFGATGIDADLIESRDGDTINLTNGCVCCSIAGGFHEAMSSVRDRATPPAWLLVEASGVSDPAVVAQYAHLDGFRLDGVIVVADAEQVRRRAADRYVGRHVTQQLRAADLVILNKVDLLDDATLADVRHWLGTTVPGGRVVEASHADVPFELVVPGPAERFGSHLPLDAPPDAGHHHDYVSWSIDVARPVAPARFDAFIDALPASVLRGKGIVTFAGHPGARHVFQLVGRRVTVRREETATTIASTRVALIARAGDDTAAVAAAVAGLRRDLEDEEAP